jgi:hypothetical protein
MEIPVMSAAHIGALALRAPVITFLVAAFYPFVWVR